MDEPNQQPPTPSEPPAETPPAPPAPTGFSFPEDKFRHGRILRFFPQSGYGFVKDAQGHDVYFHVDEIRFVGEKRDRTYVNEGAPVGFDVGVTSRGMRVTHLKIY